VFSGRWSVISVQCSVGSRIKGDREIGPRHLLDWSVIYNYRRLYKPFLSGTSGRWAKILGVELFLADIKMKGEQNK